MAADGGPQRLRFGADLGPELEAAMAEHRAEVEAIANAPWPPSFEDTIAALERAGQRLRDALLSRGAVVDPLAAVRAITGREPSVRPLLEQRGLV